MKGLMLRLSQLDANAETALRIIEVFDRLIEHHATLPAVVRTTAGLAECFATLTDEASGRLIRFDSKGRPSSTVPSSSTISTDVTIDGHRVGQVSLERGPEPGPFDELLIERMSMVASACWPQFQQGQYPFISDPALVEVVIGADQDTTQRSRARRLLGFSPNEPMCVIAVSATEQDSLNEEALSLMRQLGGARAAKAAVLDFRGAIVVELFRERATGPIILSQRAVPGELPDGAALLVPTPRGLRIGVGTVVAPEDAHSSWLAAASALRFTAVDDSTGGNSAISYRELGALAALESISSDAMRDNADIIALDGLSRTARGQAALAALESFCSCGSLRPAAEKLHLHHSSVASRLKHVEDAIGVSLDNPRHLLRMQVALTLWRLGTSYGAFTASKAPSIALDSSKMIPTAKTG